MLPPTFSWCPSIANGLVDLPRGQRGPGGIDIGQQNGELIAAEPCDRVGLPQGTLHARSRLLQQQVAVVMTERVVDLLEAIEVHDQQRDRRAVTPRGKDGLLHTILQDGAVRQPCQRVVHRQMLERHPRMGPLGHVLQDGDRELRLGFAAAHDRDGEQAAEHAPILT